ncbi:MAG: homoserine O-acetyltransferase [Planctomycetota bacterium]|jgi:homoserine O-acetyltransferase
MKRPSSAQLVVIESEFELELGGSLPRLEIAYESWGQPDEDMSNCILVIPAFSANCHARSSDKDLEKGWWEHVIGPGLAIDTDRFYVICPSLLGGCHGTTGPLSENPNDENKSYQGAFPLVTIGDLARCHLKLLEQLGIEKAYAICGGSMGAMQVLEMGIHHPACASRIVTISGTDQTRPATAAIRHLGRQAIMLDENFRDGFYGDLGPEKGIMLARQIGTVFYRSKQEFNDRFPWQPINEPSLNGITFDVQSYLAHQGGKMVGRFDANAYLRLSMAMDLHDICRNDSQRNWDLESYGAEFFVGGVEEDRLMPLIEQTELHELLIANGAKSHLKTFTSPVGHDAFLVKHDGIDEFIRDSLS